MRLDLEDAFAADVLEARHAVRQRPLAQGGESWQLAVIERDHELAAVIERDVVRLGEGFDIGLALAAESCLERARRVVQAGMEDAAVVAGLVGRELSLLLDDGHPQVRTGLQQPVRGREADDPAADDDDAGVGHAVDDTGNGMPKRSPSSTRCFAWTGSSIAPRSSERRSASASGSPGTSTRPGASGMVGAATSWSR